jgi:hypothetical protein
MPTDAQWKAIIREKVSILCTYSKHRDFCPNGLMVVPQDEQGNYDTDNAYKGTCTCGLNELLDQVLAL